MLAIQAKSFLIIPIRWFQSVCNFIMKALPWPKRDQGSRLQHFPSNGEYGYDSPVGAVGKKHFSTRLTAMQKIIFSDQTPTFPKKASVELQPKRDFSSELRFKQYNYKRTLQNSLQLPRQKPAKEVQNDEQINLGSQAQGLIEGSRKKQFKKRKAEMAALLNLISNTRQSPSEQDFIDESVYVRSISPTYLNSQIS